MTKEVMALVAKDFKLEMRRKSSMAGIFLYLLAATFVTFLVFGNIIDFKVWNALFWIITMFSVINAGAPGFSSESGDRALYYYTIAGPQEFIISKLVYNMAMALVTAMSGLFIFVLFFGLNEMPILLFIPGILLGSIGFASIVTIMSSLAAPSGGSATLVSVLSFPLMLPILISAVKASLLCVNEGYSLNLLLYWFVLLLIAAVIWVLAVILFPYIWKE
jgi:heme exporter protein B